MAALLAVGLGLGAESLSRKISEKKESRMAKKRALEHEAGERSAGAVQNGGYVLGSERKSAEVRREAEYEQRRGSEDGMGGEEPPPRYEDVVRGA
ncbi:hypothetical protein P153DRAFT_390833 [Dothidotthia symphoricarpi CBS 119687]|uniref:Uncharacterized protein n=1 Tax=Dothidotthia symphoricarpi CBS 119687 TaxID=1392245 RepID=A0A6A6A147_9PLEO|nr:uncharacterized protein P153DRAFT_390833 [Dothidotthia symphoricarpi CBS 119687]KAF2124281.1 hypothetical protein P153DRAFT_390833 [Dothidotthia symphoricarpi CBS 119687]